ncbi:MAG: hypothetical protein RL693_2269 [Verrucomicrobiota bacterium]|jgi:HAD superfamily hydrolase (TIGR01484 family)
MAKSPPSLLLSFDFDGTLIDPHSDMSFHPAMADMLREFKSRGAVWVVNTGRTLSHTLEGLAQHNIFMLPDYIIAQECEIYCQGFFTAWKDFGSWNRKARHAHNCFVDKHRDFLSEIEDHLRNGTQAMYLNGGIGQVGIVASTDEELDVICEFIEVKRSKLPDIGYNRNGRYLRFCHVDYSKGTALQELSRLLNIRPERIFAAGDNHNDLSMLNPRIAGNIACPSNALDPVKQHLQLHGGYIASKPASEGMMEALQHFFLRRS